MDGWKAESMIFEVYLDIWKANIFSIAKQSQNAVNKIMTLINYSTPTLPLELEILKEQGTNFSLEEL